MKDFKIHSDEGGNLLSIKPLEDVYSDRVYFINLILTLSFEKSYFIINASRPNYDEPDLLAKLKSVLDNKENFSYDNFELAFAGRILSQETVNLLPSIWFHYQHVTFTFFCNPVIKFNTKRIPWYDITTKVSSYVLFKGAEEDVVWIGKSKELKFDFQNIS
ncbi:hypothetical protein D3C87_875210 [compost metagenome]